MNDVTLSVEEYDTKKQVKMDIKYSINIIYLWVNERRDAVSRGIWQRLSG